jgi:hypothetical protein
MRTPDERRITETATAELADTWASAEQHVRNEFGVEQAERIIAEAELITARRRLADARRWRTAVRSGLLTNDQQRRVNHGDGVQPA